MLKMYVRPAGSFCPPMIVCVSQATLNVIPSAKEQTQSYDRYYQSVHARGTMPIRFARSLG